MPARINLLLGVGLACVFWINDQAADLLLALLGTVRPAFTASLYAGLFGLTLWYTTRNLYRVLPLDSSVPINGMIIRWIPHLLAITPLASMTLWFLWATVNYGAPSLPLAGIFGVCMVVVLAVTLFTSSKLTQAEHSEAVAPVTKAGGVLRRLIRYHTGLDVIDPFSQWILPVLLVVALLLSTSSLLTPWWASRIGPLPTIFGAASVWVVLLSAMVVTASRLKVPLLTLILLTAGVSTAFNLNDNHAVRIVSSTTEDVPSVADALVNWLSSRGDRDSYDENNPYPVYVVATAGGGIRNAYWTGVVLGALEDDPDTDFARHVFAISGVSGGSVGAAAFAGSIRYDELPGVPKNASSHRIRMKGTLGVDFLSPVLAKGLLPDAIQRLLPFAVNSFDRATALESTLEQRFKESVGGFVMPHGFQLLRSSPESDVPHLVINTTQVETGTRTPVAHLKPDGLELIQDLSASDLPLSTAAFLGARFPIVTPAGCIQTPKGERRFVDAGYFENSGTVTAAEIVRDMLTAMEDPRVSKLGLPPVEIYLVSLWYREPIGSAPYRGFGELMSPVRALMATRGARGRLALTEFKKLVARSNSTGSAVVRSFIEFDFQDNGVRLPLGWVMSQRVIDAMDHLLDDLVQQAAQQRSGPAWEALSPLRQDRKLTEESGRCSRQSVCIKMPVYGLFAIEKW